MLKSPSSKGKEAGGASDVFHKQPEVLNESLDSQGAMVGELTTIVNGKLRSLVFEDNEVKKCAPVLIGALKWEPIKDFTVITGVNGSGKSQLLRYLELVLKNHGKAVVHMKSGYMGLSGSQGGYGEASRPFMEKLTGKVKTIKSYLFKDIAPKSKSFHPYEAYLKDSILRQLRELYGTDDLDVIKIKDSLKSDVATILAKEPIVLNADAAMGCNPISILQTVLSTYKIKEVQIEVMRPFERDLEIFKKGLLLGDGEVISEEKLEEKYKDNLLRLVWGSDIKPIEEINDVLKDFKHKLHYTSGGVIEFWTKNEPSERIAVEALSSGEVMILSVLSWKYCQAGFPHKDGRRGHVTKADVMLLDEPDAHLDPKLSKLFYDVVKRTLVDKFDIQVIMTTHRMDTVALVRDDELFVIEKKEREGAYIRPCTKLLAMARMSRNIQFYTGVHVKVHTEAFDDAKFYEGIYANMMKSSRMIRENKLHEVPGADPCIRKLYNLSRRYQMGFYSAGFKNGKSGGFEAVKEIVKREVSHVDSRQSLLVHPTVYANADSYVANIFRAYKVDVPFGIIDRDYQDNTSDLSEENRYRVIRLKRHSLENFMYDPIFMCSVFKDELDLESWLKDGGFRLRMKDLYNQINGNISGALFNNNLYIIYQLMFEAILNHGEQQNEGSFLNELKERLKSNIPQFFKQRHQDKDALRIEALWRDCINSVPNESLLKAAKTQTPDNRIDNLVINKDWRCSQSDLFRSINEVGKTVVCEVSEGLRDVYDNMRAIIKDVGINNLLNKQSYFISAYGSEGGVSVIDAPYPIDLKRVRGHDLADAMKTFVNSGYKQMMLNCIIERSLDPKANIVIPVDLMETIVELNGKIKLQVVEKADPEKLFKKKDDRAWLEDKGYNMQQRSWVDRISHNRGLDSFVARAASVEDGAKLKQHSFL